ncbi:hypothetical protein BGX29_006072 [Mortierella sp. GBA35]|nr:hypothetical protein BGX29_006072 [Mortierella sp. GBA35]
MGGKYDSIEGGYSSYSLTAGARVREKDGEIQDLSEPTPADVIDKEKAGSRGVVEAEATVVAMSKLGEVELGKQLEAERASSERQIGELKQ